LYSPETQARIDQLTQNFISKGIDPTTAHNQAIASIGNIVRREAYVMAYNDSFYFVGFALLVSGLSLLFCKKVKPGAGAAAH
jgi:DHA2 family multidrug resistance protein